MKKWIYLSLLLSAAFLGWKFRPVVAATEPIVTEREQLEKALTRLMWIHNSQVSPVMKTVTIRTLIDTADSILTTYDQKINWFVLLGNESKFNNLAKSPAGALGIGQIIPKFSKDFAAHCSLDGLKESDLQDLTVNATVSACLFRHLVEELNGSIPEALAAYNAGRFSKTADDLKKLKNINQETANYITRFYYVKEKLTSE